MARSQTQNQGIFQKRNVYSVEGRKPENQYIQSRTRGTRIVRQKRVRLTAGQLITQGHSKLEVLPNSLTLVFSIIWLTVHQQQNKDQNALTGNKRK